MKFSRWVFLLAAIYGVLALVPMYFQESIVARVHPPAITHAEYYYGFIGVALAWQLAFLLLSHDPLRYRPIMLPAAMEKLTFGIAMLALLILARSAGDSMSFTDFPGGAQGMSGMLRAVVGLLLLLGFGAKLGLLPFYEWFPAAYGAGSGASGALMSGVVLNAAFYGLSRGLLEWAPGQNAAVAAGIGVFLIAVAVLSAVLTALYAFQQEDWRTLLSFSSAENASHGSLTEMNDKLGGLLERLRKPDLFRGRTG